MNPGSRIFVLVLFLTLAAAFLAETAVFIHEFKDTNWFTLATHDSHLFIFFPTLGLVALAAFYLPASAFTDLTWYKKSYRRGRFVAGFVVLVLLSLILASPLWFKSNPSIWEIAPRALLDDTAEPTGCGSEEKPCERARILDSLDAARRVSQSRTEIASLALDCTGDMFIEQQANEPRRYCLASTAFSLTPHLSSREGCCKAQAAYQRRLQTLHEPPDRRSLTGLVHAVVLPIKIFFLLMLGVISVLLVLRHHEIQELYGASVERIERSVIVGAAAMVLFPLMTQSYVDMSEALYGIEQSQDFKPIVALMTVAFSAWALLLLLFFYRRHDREIEILGKIAGVLASAIALVKFDVIVGFVGRHLGAGATVLDMAALAVLAITLVIVLLAPSETRPPPPAS